MSGGFRVPVLMVTSLHTVASISCSNTNIMCIGEIFAETPTPLPVTSQPVHRTAHRRKHPTSSTPVAVRSTLPRDVVAIRHPQRHHGKRPEVDRFIVNICDLRCGWHWCVTMSCDHGFSRAWGLLNFGTLLRFSLNVELQPAVQSAERERELEIAIWV